MPARHTSLPNDLLLEEQFPPKALVDERGCRRDIRSNGWIVFRKSSLSQKRSGRRNQFSSFGADLPVRNFTGPKPGLKSGPDVFADALVLRNALFPGKLRFPERSFPGMSSGPRFKRLASSSPDLSSIAGKTQTVGSAIRWPRAGLCCPSTGISNRSPRLTPHRRPASADIRSTLAQWLSLSQAAG